MNKYLPKIVGSYLNILSYISSGYAANKALHIFSKPRKGKLSDKNKTFLETATPKDLFFKELKISTYNWKGDGPTLLLAHGWESNSARWKKKIKRFTKEGFNIYALDAPAHGGSGSKEFNALLYAEFINVVVNYCNPEIIIGHSVGGMASVFFQQKYQNEHIQKIVLLGAPSEFRGVLRQYIKMLGYNKKIEHRLDTVILDKFGAKPDVFSTSELIKNIDAEGLIIHDKKDTIIPFSDAKLIEKNLKKGELIQTTGLGHSLNHDSVSEKILEFIKN